MKTMKIVIKEPVLFFSDGDEDFFFEWLKSIEAVKNFVRVPRGLEITLTDPVHDFCLRELLGLTMRYGPEMKWLKVLQTPENESWFADERAYWHEKVFKD